MHDADSMLKALPEAQVDVVWASGPAGLTSGVPGRGKALRAREALEWMPFNSHIDVVVRDDGHEHEKTTTTPVTTTRRERGRNARSANCNADARTKPTMRDPEERRPKV